MSLCVVFEKVGWYVMARCGVFSVAWYHSTKGWRVAASLTPALCLPPLLDNARHYIAYKFRGSVTFAAGLALCPSVRGHACHSPVCAWPFMSCHSKHREYCDSPLQQTKRRDPADVRAVGGPDRRGLRCKKPPGVCWIHDIVILFRKYIINAYL